MTAYLSLNQDKREKSRYFHERENGGLFIVQRRAWGNVKKKNLIFAIVKYKLFHGISGSENGTVSWSCSVVPFCSGVERWGSSQCTPWGRGRV